MAPTESSAVGAAGALIIAITRRKLPWSELTKVLVAAFPILSTVLVR